MAEKEKILSIKDLEVTFKVRGRNLTAIRGVDLDIYKGESIAIVGESGSGKSVLTKTFSGMLDSNGYISNGTITYYDESLSSTRCYNRSENSLLFKVFFNKLNKYSRYESVASIFNEIEAFKKKIADESGVSDEFINSHKKEIYDLEFDRVELFNKKQTLTKKNDAAEINEINLKMKEIAQKKKQAEIEFANITKETKKQYFNDKERVQNDKKHLEELKDKYKNNISLNISDELIERNKKIARDLVLSVSRYPYIEKIKAIYGILKCFKNAQKRGVDISKDEVLDELYSKYAFRVKYYYHRQYPTLENGKPNMELMKCFWKINELTRCENFYNDLELVKKYENEYKSIENKKSDEYKVAYEKYFEAYIDYGKKVNLYQFNKEKLDRNEIFARKIYLSLKDKLGSEKKNAYKNIFKCIEDEISSGKKLENIDMNQVFEGIAKFDDTSIDVELGLLPHDNGKKCSPYWYGLCKNSLEKFKLNRDWQQIRGKRIATVFQDPMTSLNPIIPIGKQITDCILKHQNLTLNQAEKKAKQLMMRVGITNPEKRFNDYPFQYSGGMRQRIVIAIALSCEPEILICDEPTTALDVTIQAQIIRLIKDLQKELGFTIVFITHDLGVVANVADRVAVLYAGQIVEIGNVDEVFYDPRHPYTWALLSSLPQLSTKGSELYSITGTPPSLYNKINGDPFAPRNPYRMAIDFVKAPPMFKITETHYAKTWLLDPRAPHVEKPEIIRDIHNKLNHTVYSNEYSLINAENGENDSAIAEEVKHENDNSEVEKNKEVLLSLHNVDIEFGKGKNAVKAVKNATFDIYKGETFSLVGESGSGKTTIGRAIIRINNVANGEILFKGKRISGKISRKEDRDVVRNIQMVFQDPAASLNERATIEYIIGEGLDNFKLYENDKDRINKIEEIVNEVGLLPEHLTRYPHEFSGGQRQRVGLARSIVMKPEFIIADEPISALDVSIRAQVLNLLKKFQREKNITYLFIAHDLSIVRFISDRIGVIYKGDIVEIAESEELFLYPLHPYTKSLLSAIPVPDPEIEKNKKLYVYDPSIHDYSTDAPKLQDVGHNHLVFCNTQEFEKYKEIRNK